MILPRLSHRPMVTSPNAGPKRCAECKQSTSSVQHRECMAAALAARKLRRRDA